VKNFVVKTTWKRPGSENDKIDLKGKKSVVASWINLAEERDKWWVIINMEMKLRVLKMRRTPSQAGEIQNSQEGLGSM
jgi:hypothetical protein